MPAKHVRGSAQLVCAMLAALAMWAHGPGSLPGAEAALARLYDGMLGGTPDSQGMIFQSTGGSQQAADGSTTLETFASAGVLAGYIGRPDRMPILDRARGYRVRIAIRLLRETHSGDRNGDGLDDRAGFALVVIGADQRGIELGFWRDRVWAQADGSDGPGRLFTQAEGVTVDSAARLRRFTLVVLDERYQLQSEQGITILAGRLRGYAASGATYPYNAPNMLFVGDDTTSASAEVRLAQVEIGTLEQTFLPHVRR